MGNLQDPTAAERQIAQFQARIDDLETEYLDAFEEQEALDLQEGHPTRQYFESSKTNPSDHRRFETIRPSTEDRLAVLEAESEALLDKMNPSVANLYRLMNAKVERAVAGVRNDSCGACFMKLPTELLWTGLHRSTICHCPYCSVFLIPEDLD